MSTYLLVHHLFGDLSISLANCSFLPLLVHLSIGVFVSFYKKKTLSSRDAFITNIWVNINIQHYYCCYGYHLKDTTPPTLLLCLSETPPLSCAASLSRDRTNTTRTTRKVSPLSSAHPSNHLSVQSIHSCFYSLISLDCIFEKLTSAETCCNFIVKSGSLALE